MRSRCLLFLFAFLLSIASLAGAAPENPDCNPLLIKMGVSPLADPTLSPQDAQTLYCGSCSVTICRGMPYNAICQGGIVIKRCIAAYGLDCPADGLPQCQCWSGPLP